MLWLMKISTKVGPLFQFMVCEFGKESKISFSVMLQKNIIVCFDNIFCMKKEFAFGGYFLDSQSDLVLDK